MVRTGSIGVLIVIGAVAWLVLMMRILQAQADDMAVVSEEFGVDIIRSKGAEHANDTAEEAFLNSDTAKKTQEIDRNDVINPAATKKTGEPSGRAADEDCINVNSANAQQLQQLHGIGPVLAKRICAYRTQHGVFSIPDDLRDVKGIGPATVKKIRTAICF